MSVEAPVAPKAADKTSLRQFFMNNIREYSMLLSLVGIMIFFQFATDGALFNAQNLTNIILQNSYVIVMALGMLLVIVSGHIDLSVGSVAGFVGGVAGLMIVKQHIDPLVTILACLVLGGIVGAVQGYFIAFWRVPSFIVTLAGMLVFRGLCIAVLQGASIGPFPVEFQRLSIGFIPDPFGKPNGINVVAMAIGILVPALLIYFNLRKRRTQIKHGVETEPMVFFVVVNALFFALIAGLCYRLATLNGLPNVLIIMGVLIAMYTFITTRTTIGRRIYAIGGNEKAAKLSGINTERLTFYTFINLGVLAALAGLIISARLNSAVAKAGTGFELDVIAACFIGGASATGGVGKITGAVVGAFIMGVMNNGMSILGIGIDYQQVIKGLVLLAAVFFDVYNKNKG